ncbi:MAG: hypothetical protein IT327_00575 [Anaerolineae bacterium]|nr:hypothetical protein [Anaerolineae bacterium]
MGNKNRKRFAGIIVLSLAGIFLLSCGLTYQLIVKQCVFWTCAPTRTFTIYDLILPTDLYPSNAVINPMISFPEAPGADSGNLAVYWEENGQLNKSILTIERFGTEGKAIEYFDILESWRTEGTYRPHPDILYQSQTASEYEIGCGISGLGGEYECDVDARYKEFVVSLNVSITGQMSEKDFEAIAVSLDKQFEAFLTD